MSNMAEISQLTDISTTPVDWYLDPKFLKLKNVSRSNKDRVMWVTKRWYQMFGDYYVPEWMDNAKVLVRNKQGI